MRPDRRLAERDREVDRDGRLTDAAFPAPTAMMFLTPGTAAFAASGDNGRANLGASSRSRRSSRREWRLTTAAGLIAHLILDWTGRRGQLN